MIKSIIMIKVNAWKKSTIMVKVNIGQSMVNNIEMIKINQQSIISHKLKKYKDQRRTYKPLSKMKCKVNQMKFFMVYQMNLPKQEKKKNGKRVGQIGV